MLRVDSCWAGVLPQHPVGRSAWATASVRRMVELTAAQSCAPQDVYAVTLPVSYSLISLQGYAIIVAGLADALWYWLQRVLSGARARPASPFFAMLVAPAFDAHTSLCTCTAMEVDVSSCLLLLQPLHHPPRHASARGVWTCGPVPLPSACTPSHPFCAEHRLCPLPLLHSCEPCRSLLCRGPHVGHIPVSAKALRAAGVLRGRLCPIGICCQFSSYLVR